MIAAARSRRRQRAKGWYPEATNSAMTAANSALSACCRSTGVNESPRARAGPDHPRLAVPAE